MSEQNITCPHCGKEFPLSSTLTHQLDISIRKKIEEEYEMKQNEFIKKEKNVLWMKAKEEAKKKLEKELTELKNDQVEKNIQSFKEKEELEEKIRLMKIDTEKQKQEVRKEAINTAKKEMDEEYRLKKAEDLKEKEQMAKTIQDLKRQSEQGSMQVQGDALETDIKQHLIQSFPFDEISDVATGVRGADIIHKLKSQLNELTGIILWECKNTKTYSRDWINKLKKDQIIAKADVSILVTKVLPEKVVDLFIFLDGVYVVTYSSAIPLARIIRINLEIISKMRKSLVGNDEKLKALGQYIHSSEFANKFQGMLRTFILLKGDLDKERNALKNIWARREKQLDQAIENAATIYGDLEGTSGQKLPPISELELSDGLEPQNNVSKEDNDPHVELF